MLAGAPITCLSQRQHITAPDSHTSEITAAGAAVYSAVMLRAGCQEMHILQEFPTPIYCDSASTLFVANDSGSIKKSAWSRRRAIVLRKSVMMGEIAFIKIGERDNVADGLTKPIVHDVFARHLEHTHQWGDATGLGDAQERHQVAVALEISGTRGA